MGGGGGGGNARELDQTPTWAVASVCGVIVIISILLEKGLHHVGEFFSHRKKKAMVEALEKVKAELMVLGFISLNVRLPIPHFADKKPASHVFFF